MVSEEKTEAKPSLISLNLSFPLVKSRIEMLSGTNNLFAGTDQSVLRDGVISGSNLLCEFLSAEKLFNLFVHWVNQRVVSNEAGFQFSASSTSVIHP